MEDLQTVGLRIINNQLSILDQKALPLEECWLVCDSVERWSQYVLQLSIRGAPLIGLSAALLLALLAECGTERKQLLNYVSMMIEVRPTAVNLYNNLQIMRQALKQNYDIAEISRTALQLFYDDEKACRLIAELGSSLLSSNSQILTYCNTGSLATAGMGTALGIIKHGFVEKKIAHVWICETRPLLQGARLTSWELQKYHIPCTLLVDAAAAALIAQGKVDAIIVGADRIAVNGDVANKIGTYNLAILAKFHNIPFYVAAPQTTLDKYCTDGRVIPIELRQSEELYGFKYNNLEVCWTPRQLATYNPAFDITPATLITAWILDSGIIKNNYSTRIIWDSSDEVVI